MICEQCSHIQVCAIRQQLLSLPPAIHINDFKCDFNTAPVHKDVQQSQHSEEEIANLLLQSRPVAASPAMSSQMTMEEECSSCHLDFDENTLKEFDGELLCESCLGKLKH